jgi:hypothetical protein
MPLSLPRVRSGLASTLLADVNGIDNDEARDVVLAAIAAFITEGQSNH